MSGNYDTIIAGMSITDERDEVIDFTQAYTPPDPSLYLAASDDVDVRGGVIAAQTGTIQAGYVAEPAAPRWSSSPRRKKPSPRSATARPTRCWPTRPTCDPIVDEDAGLMVVGDPVALGGGVGMGVRESDAELKAKFDAAIQSMKDDGSLNELIAEMGSQLRPIA